MDYIASAMTSIIVGILMMVVFILFGNSRNPDHTLNVARIGSVGISATAGYTCSVLIVCQFAFNIPLSTVIHEKFHDERLGWILVVFVFEYLVRLCNDFWRHKPRASALPPQS